MTAEEFVRYVTEHRYEKYCFACKQWSSNDQETWGPCCYDYRDVHSTLAHLQILAVSIAQKN